MTNDYRMMKRVLTDKTTPWTSAEYRLAAEALDRIQAERDRYREEARKYDGGWCTKCGQPFEDSVREVSTEGGRASLEGTDQ